VAITERAKTSDPAESRLTSAHDGAVEAPVTGGVAVVRAVPLDEVDEVITALGGAPRPGATAVAVSG